jgi:tetratricopeptide (TPR) repeat protein
MRNRRWLGRALALLLSGCATFCGKPLSLDEIKARVTQARDEAKNACDAKRTSDAVKAGKRAEKLAKQAAERSECTVKGEARPAVCGEIHSVAREARRFADRADEEKRLADLTTGFKAKAYRTARDLAVKAALTGLIAAVDAAHRDGVSQCPIAVRDAAGVAKDVAFWLAWASDPTGQPPEDWTGIRAVLARAQSHPPRSLNAFLALGFAVTAQSKLALYEIEGLDSSAIEPKAAEPFYWGLRGLILSQNGLPQTAIDNFERAAAVIPAGDRAWGGQELGAIAQLVLSVIRHEQGDDKEADLAVSRSIQLWPNNPVAIWLTGERQLADGQYEKARDSLEAAAARDELCEPMARRITARARQVRDKPGEAQPIIYDKTVLRGIVLDLVVCGIKDAAKTSPTAQRLDQALTAARAFVTTLPGFGKGDEAPPTATTPAAGP